jgi:MATE family multidrug resistance protein
MTERRTIMHHAATVLVGQLAVMAFGITDTWVAGRYADTALAALSVASATYITVHISLMGILQALLPVWAELQGAQNFSDVGRSVRQALYLWLLTSAIAVTLLLCPGPLLAWTGVPEALQAEVRDYLMIVAISAPASLLFRLYGSLNQALGKPKLVTWLQVGALAIKVPLSLLLVMGWPPLFAPMGLAGCAWATVWVNLLMVAAAIHLMRTSDFYTPYRLWQRLEAPNAKVLRHFLRLGVPSGLTIAVEVTSFTLVALFVARLGVVASASHQIMANMAACLYMVPLSLSIASSARISYWLGAGQPQWARRSLRTGLGLVLASAALLSLMVWLSRDHIAGFFTPSLAVLSLTSQMLAWLALYHGVDALQVFVVFALRCYHVTVRPLMTYTVMLWGIGLGGGYALAYGGLQIDGLPVLATQSPLAFWQASLLALGLTCAVLSPLLWRRSRARQAA